MWFTLKGKAFIVWFTRRKKCLSCVSQLDRKHSFIMRIISKSVLWGLQKDETSVYREVYTESKNGLKRNCVVYRKRKNTCLFRRSRGRKKKVLEHEKTGEPRMDRGEK